MGTNFTVAKNTSLIRKLFNFPKGRQDLRHPMGNQKIRLIPQTLQPRGREGSGKPGEQVSCQAFTSYMITKKKKKMWAAIFVTELPSCFTFVIKLCCPLQIHYESM